MTNQNGKIKLMFISNKDNNEKLSLVAYIFNTNYIDKKVVTIEILSLNKSNTIK